MDQRVPDPALFLPHGPGMRLLDGPGSVVDGWLTFQVRLSTELVVCGEDGVAPAELGLEIMAQACGMAIVIDGRSGSAGAMRGVVGAIRGYEYSTNPLVLSQSLVARVKRDLVDGNVVVCDAELLHEGETSPLQMARITIVLMGEDFT
jgi:predicted hotdog family 3-hydroxylacyl-ACP dehydratase